MFSEIGAFVFIILFPSMLLFVASYLIKVWKVERRLEKQHSSKWQELGCPNLIKNNTFRNNRRFLKFLRKKNYSSLNDSVLTSYSKSCYKLYKASIITFLLLFISVLLFQLVPAVI